MTSRDFCYWLQGFLEIRNANEADTEGGLTGNQVQVIEKHLAMVFKHEIDPSFGGPAKQAELNKMHLDRSGYLDGLVRC